MSIPPVNRIQTTLDRSATGRYAYDRKRKMKLVEVLQILGALVGAFVSIAMAAEMRLLKLLRTQGAVSPEYAVTLPGLRALPRWRLAGLIKHGAVRKTADGSFYLDAITYKLVRRRRAMTAIPAVCAALVFVVVLHILFG